ncbi:MAG: hypothetical protein COX32_01130 [Candidatus Moranbacteria bacterium CG23_combo_of_CG06-09_8_20_14_all_41_28]|nr:MAG: hypothetical protein COX32_01130 [Candidatus Moranbacteria bacterium CG23_combo_of_CG06-09_8_20_14_all_41_28]
MVKTRYPDSSAASSGAYGTSTTTTPASTATQTTSTGSSQNLSEISSQQNMTPEALAQLSNLIKTLEAGGTPEQRASEIRRRQTQSLIEQLLGTVSTERATQDAKGIMALNLQQAMEKNMPAIQRAIEGAGTSASSMQGVLSQQAARDAALASGALGGQMAAQYARERSSLAGILEAATRPTNDVTDALIQSLGVAKGAVTNSQRNRTAASSGVSNTVINTPESTVTETRTPSESSPFSDLATTPESSNTSSALANLGKYWSDNSNQYWKDSGVSLAAFLSNPQY